MCSAVLSHLGLVYRSLVADDSGVRGVSGMVEGAQRCQRIPKPLLEGLRRDKIDTLGLQRRKERRGEMGREERERGSFIFFHPWDLATHFFWLAL